MKTARQTMKVNFLIRTNFESQLVRVGGSILCESVVELSKIQHVDGAWYIDAQIEVADNRLSVAELKEALEECFENDAELLFIGLAN